MSTPRLWIRCYSWTWMDHLKRNLSTPGAMRPGDNGIAGFWIHESFAQGVNTARLQSAIQSCRALGFIANPGLVWHMGSDIADPSRRWEAWLDRMAWWRRAGATAQMLAMQDSRCPMTSCDVEMYNSSGDKMPPIAQLFNVALAAASIEPILAGQNIAFCPGVVQYPQTIAMTWMLRRLTAMGEENFNLARKVDDPVRLADAITQIVDLSRAWKRLGISYSPGVDQDLVRDWAAPVRAALATALVDDVWVFLDVSKDDALQFGTESWRERPHEPPTPPDPAAMGLMAFDVNIRAITVGDGPCTILYPVVGSIAPTFLASVATQLVEETLPVPRKFLRFDPAVAGQGFRANLGRQLSADYTLYFVGVPPQPFGGNDGTGWQLGPFRFSAQQSPSARWLWGGAFVPATTGKRHVIVCEQRAGGLLKILIDGVEVGSAQGVACQPDGTMAIGNVDAMNSRACKMDLERLTVFEGVDRSKSQWLSRQYCDWYGIEWRGGE